MSGQKNERKTDERNEFNGMIRFVRNQHEGISLILVGEETVQRLLT
jgi:hypothetical protein